MIPSTKVGVLKFSCFSNIKSIQPIDRSTYRSNWSKAAFFRFTASFSFCSLKEKVILSARNLNGSVHNSNILLRILCGSGGGPSAMCKILAFKILLVFSFLLVACLVRRHVLHTVRISFLNTLWKSSWLKPLKAFAYHGAIFMHPRNCAICFESNWLGLNSLHYWQLKVGEEETTSFWAVVSLLRPQKLHFAGHGRSPTTKKLEATVQSALNLIGCAFRWTHCNTDSQKLEAGRQQLDIPLHCMCDLLIRRKGPGYLISWGFLTARKHW